MRGVLVTKRRANGPRLTRAKKLVLGGGHLSTLHWPTDPCGVYREATRSLHRLQLIFSIVHMESTRSLHGVYMESTRMPCRLHAFTWTIHGVYVVDSAWSLHGVYMESTRTTPMADYLI